MMNDPTIEQLQARLKESEATNQLLHEAMVIAEKRGVDKGKEEAELRIKELEAALTEIKDCRITNGSWASLPLWRAMSNIATEALKPKGA